MKLHHSQAISVAVCFLFTGLFSRVTGDVPQQLNYQGRVSVQGVNFTGTGQFKFALVDAGTNQNVTATAVSMAAGSVTFIFVQNGGSGYNTAPAVTVAPPAGGGITATATSTIAGGVVNSITITNGGSGYVEQPVVTIAPPPPSLTHQIYWSNAGDLAADEVPPTSVSLPVTGGLYSVRLGDASIANMAPFNPDIFYTPLFLRVWFDDGVHGFQQLTPDQALASAPYAMQARLAESVPSGSIGSFQLANGAVSSAKLATGAAAANLTDSGQSGVASGGVVLANVESPTLVSAGYIRDGTMPVGDTWESHPNAPLAPRYRHTAVWTGTEMIVWGGINDSPTPFGDGARYHPTTRVWTALPAGGGARSQHFAVWTGTEMIVWGGYGAGGTPLTTGGRYSPVTNLWTATSTNAAPSSGRAAIWTGSEMIVLSDTPAGDARYNPATDSWTPMTSVGSPAARTGSITVWTGSEMIVFGGYVSDFNVQVNTGAKYNPSTDTWTPIANAIVTSLSRRGVWTGTQMIVAGATTGQVYTLATNSWDFFNSASAPQELTSPEAPVWTGSEMIVADGFHELLHSYDVLTDTWRKTVPEISFGLNGTGVWTGSELLLFGGQMGGGYVNRLLSYRPLKNFILYRRP